jgi:hypothetical protein
MQMNSKLVSKVCLLSILQGKFNLFVSHLTIINNFIQSPNLIHKRVKGRSQMKLIKFAVDA